MFSDNEREEYRPRNLQTPPRAARQAKTAAAPKKRKLQEIKEAEDMQRLRDELKKQEAQLDGLKADLKAAKERELHLKCGICLCDRPRSPVSACSKGHLFCAACLYSWAIAKRRVELDTEFVFDARVIDPPFKCPLCNEESELADIKLHSQLSAVLLPYVDTSTCQHCACDVARNDGLHVFDCPQESVTCPQCSERVHMNLLYVHATEDCDQFTCSQCVGGTMRFTAHGLASHRQGHVGMDQTLDYVSQELGHVIRLAIAGNGRVQRQSHFTGMHFLFVFAFL